MNAVRRFFENHLITPLLNGAWPSASTDLAWIDMADQGRIVFFASLQTAAPDGTVELVVRQAKTSGGGSAKNLVDGDVTAKIANTSLVDAATPSGVWVAIEVEAALMDINNGFRFLTVAPAETATGTLYGTILAVHHYIKDRPVTQGAECAELVYFDG
jgi:hypothetical protein